MNLQEQIVNELGEQMSSALDFVILSDVLVNACGWHKVELERFENNRHATDIAYWCHDNIKHEWKRNGSHFIFEDIGDAVNFTMRWQC